MLTAPIVFCNCLKNKIKYACTNINIELMDKISLSSTIKVTTIISFKVHFHNKVINKYYNEEEKIIETLSSRILLVLLSFFIWPLCGLSSLNYCFWLPLQTLGENSQ